MALTYRLDRFGPRGPGSASAAPNEAVLDRQGERDHAPPSLVVRLRSAVSGPVAPGWRHVPITALVLMMVAVGLQPALPEEEQAMTTVEAVLGYGILGFVFLSYMGSALITARGNRAGLVLSVPATLLMLLLVVTCPVSGHHSWASWVPFSFGAAFLATGLHAASLYSTRRS